MELYDIKAKNFGPYEDMEMSLYKQGLVWIGGKNHDTAAADSNGSGKTTMFRALTWCLYGETIDGEKGDKVIHKGAKKAEVYTRLLDGKEKWTIGRTRTKGAPNIVLLKPDGTPYKASKDDLQAKIVEMIGLDFRAFKNTVLYGQNDSARFAHPRTKDSERKDMLHRIMRTELLAECHEWVKAEAKKLRAKDKDAQVQIHSLQMRIDEHDVEGLEEKYSEWEADRKAVAQSHKLQAKEYKQQALEVMAEAEEDVELPDVDGLKRQLKIANKEVKKAEKAEAIVEKIVEELYGLDNELDQKNKECFAYGIDIKAINEQLGELDGDKCPVCTSPLDEGAALSRIKELECKRDEAQKRHVKALKEYSRIEAVVGDKTVELKAHQKVTSTLSRLLKQIAAYREAIAEAEAEIKAHEHRAEEAEERARHFIELARKSLKASKTESAKINPYEAQLSEAMDRVTQYVENIKELESGSEAVRNELSHYEFWVRGFSNQGLPSYILDAVMPYITDRANYYLETLADGDITMNFTTQRELKSSKGDYRDEIDIQWQIEGLEDSYPPSGGQLKKMEIATDLALMDLVATREGGHLDMLMLDEVLDGLDGEGCNRVLLLLQNLRSARGTIFVISHETEVAEVFEKALFAVKKGGKTKLVSKL